MEIAGKRCRCYFLEAFSKIFGLLICDLERGPVLL